MDFASQHLLKGYLFFISNNGRNNNNDFHYRSSKDLTKWYVLRVVSGKERKVKEYLDKEVNRSGWSETIKQVFLPMEKVYKVQNGKKVMREKNYFPGYVMIEVSDGKLTDDMVQHISNVSNVMHFLTDGKGSKGNIISLRKLK